MYMDFLYFHHDYSLALYAHAQAHFLFSLFHFFFSINFILSVKKLVFKLCALFKQHHFTYSGKMKEFASSRTIVFFSGFLLDKKIGVNQPKRLEKAKILIANTPMDTDKIKVIV